MRRDIVRVANEILSETQSVEFSLRELARRAGISHNAPYKHFATKGELLAVVSAAGFQTLTTRVCREIAGANNARERLFAIARAYIRSGVENPALFRLMFGGYVSGPDIARSDVERAAVEKIKILVAGAIADGALGRAIPNDRESGRKIARAVLVCWSLVHGFTFLLVNRLVGPTKKSDALGEKIIQGIIDGLATKLPALPLGTSVRPHVPPS